jgi:hypothetical protein
MTVENGIPGGNLMLFFQVTVFGWPRAQSLLVRARAFFFVIFLFKISFEQFVLCPPQLARSDECPLYDTDGRPVPKELDTALEDEYNYIMRQASEYASRRVGRVICFSCVRFVEFSAPLWAFGPQR